MNCTKCGKPATYVEQYGQWYCDDCKGYIPPPPPPPAKSNLGLAIGLPLGILGGIVVLGILAAVAIPAFMSYSKKVKGSEAEVNLEALYRSVKTHAVVNGAVPTASAGPTPPLGHCCTSGGKCAPDRRLWTEDPVWRELDFSIDVGHYYSYEYTSSGDTFTVRAYGDLDCDSIMSTYEMVGIGDGSGGVSKGPLTKLRPNE